MKGKIWNVKWTLRRVGKSSGPKLLGPQSPPSMLTQLSNPCSSNVCRRQIRIIWCNLLIKGSCGLYPQNLVLFWIYNNDNKIYSLLTIYYGLGTFQTILHVFLIESSLQSCEIGNMISFISHLRKLIYREVNCPS